MRYSMIASAAAAALVMSQGVSMSDAGFGESDQIGPGKGSKGMVRGRVAVEPNEYTTPKTKSESLKRLLAKKGRR